MVVHRLTTLAGCGKIYKMERWKMFNNKNILITGGTGSYQTTSKHNKINKDNKDK